MTKTLNEIYEKLKIDVLWLHGRWKIYRQLFGTNEKRIDLLNQASGNVFIILKESLLNDVTLNLCRLTDAYIMKDKKNICLESILNKLNIKAHANIIQKLRKQYNKLKKFCLTFRKHRNKRLAHRDWNVGLNRYRGNLPGISRKKVEKALSELRKFLYLFEDYFNISSPSYNNISTRSDGDTLIYTLKQAIAFRNAVKSDRMLNRFFINSKYYDA
jgi:hypothetical protein